MCGILATCLLAFALQACVKGIAANQIGQKRNSCNPAHKCGFTGLRKLVDRLADEALLQPLYHRRELDSTVLGKTPKGESTAAMASKSGGSSAGIGIAELEAEAAAKEVLLEQEDRRKKAREQVEHLLCEMVLLRRELHVLKRESRFPDRRALRWSAAARTIRACRPWAALLAGQAGGSWEHPHKALLAGSAVGAVATCAAEVVAAMARRFQRRATAQLARRAERHNVTTTPMPPRDVGGIWGFGALGSWVLKREEEDNVTQQTHDMLSEIQTLRKKLSDNERERKLKEETTQKWDRAALIVRACRPWAALLAGAAVGSIWEDPQKTVATWSDPRKAVIAGGATVIATTEAARAAAARAGVLKKATAAARRDVQNRAAVLETKVADLRDYLTSNDLCNSSKVDGGRAGDFSVAARRASSIISR
eukprot:gnl/TRDRNA2_/TRDRNA2_66652_c0_seq1.p1 gnl/TRDRNA2_/TRDRNA2_66652_c0~~gnl/TRDRNA2_/TRDRNA2_66652_c0_seq1.p1  ORF type:complete len:423 (+),score=50.33 gnl/TRDRNA2_/TRDRNA2_66652_c0_seq1:1-1269(+)